MSIRSASEDELQLELSKPPTESRWVRYQIRVELGKRASFRLRRELAADLEVTTDTEIRAALTRIGPWVSGESTILTKHRVRLEKRLVSILGLDAPEHLVHKHVKVARSADPVVEFLKSASRTANNPAHAAAIGAALEAYRSAPR